MKTTRKVIALASVALLGGAGISAALLHGESSASPARGPSLILYSGPDFTGESLVVTGTVLDLPRITKSEDDTFDWNDKVRSLKVLSGTWRLYQNGRLNTVIDETSLESLDLSRQPLAPGWSCLVSATSDGPVEFAVSEGGDWNDDISSIELVSERNLPDWAME